jgi:hypothetical protein
MKFFSNEAKDTDEDRDRAEADTVTVPQQRAGSPWSDAPGATEDEIAAREDRPGTEELPEQARADDVDTPWTRPATDRPEAEAGGTTYGPNGAVVEEGRADQEEDRDRAETDAVKDEGSLDSPTAVEPGTDEAAASDRATATDDVAASDRATATDDVAASDRATATDDVAAREDDDRDKTDAVDTHVAGAAAVPVAAAAVPVAATAVPVDSGTGEGRATDDDTVPVVAAATAVPGAAASPADRFFPDGDAYAERFRDIQLRFVDNPKDATAEAAALLGEALDKLAEALKSQQGALASGSEDTEKLRVELRGYRDLLNRVVTL